MAKDGNLEMSFHSSSIMNKLTAHEVDEFNTIRKFRDSKNLGMLTAFINNQDCSNFLKVEALLARAYVHLSDGQDSFALQDLKAAKRLANENLEVQYLAELIEGRKFASTVTTAPPSPSPGYPNDRPPSVASSSSHINESLIPSGDSLSQTLPSMSTLSLDSGPQTPMHQPQLKVPFAPAQPSIIWEDLEIQRQLSLFKLQFVKGEVHKDHFCLAYDRPLIQILPSLETVRHIAFSVRSKHPVNLRDVCVYDFSGKPCPWFFIHQVDLYHYATTRQPTKTIDCNNCHWENKESFHEVIVCKIVFQGNSPPLPGNKVEGYIVFSFSNQESEAKIFQLIQTTPEEFHSIKHEKVSIEEYCAPQVPMKNRNIVSPSQNIDRFRQELEKQYPLKRLKDDECPNVQQLRPDLYKQALHNALLFEECAHMDALMDLSLETVLEVNKNMFPCEEGFFLVNFKCPYMVSEESVRGHALMNVATHVMISRMEDRRSPNASVNILKADIVSRIFRTEYEQYSQKFQLKKEFRNLHFTVKIHLQSFSNIFRNVSQQEMWFVEFGFDRYQFLECHYSVDQISDPSVFFAGKKQLSSKNRPPWHMENQVHKNSEERYRAQIANKVFERRDRYICSDLLHRQQDACEAALYDCRDRVFPPVVIHGPSGTGKTHTLSYATKMILESGRNARILICVVSRNTGNYYHQSLVNKNFGNKCLRLFGKNEDISHVDQQLIEYSNYCNGSFQHPTAKFVRSRCVIIVSVQAAMILHEIGISSSDFMHVFIEDATQVAEFYLAPVLAFASRKNRIVVTGDVMHLNPELLSVPLSNNFRHSIVERFSKLVYTKPCGFSYELEVNYRFHEDIGRFAYKHFYPDIVKNERYNNRSKDVNFDEGIPGVARLMFISVRGLQSNHDQLVSRCNWIEADRIARVLYKFTKEIKWNIQSKDIGIVTAFKGQVQVRFLLLSIRCISNLSRNPTGVLFW